MHLCTGNFYSHSLANTKVTSEDYISLKAASGEMFTANYMSTYVSVVPVS